MEQSRKMAKLAYEALDEKLGEAKEVVDDTKEKVEKVTPARASVSSILCFIIFHFNFIIFSIR